MALVLATPTGAQNGPDDASVVRSAGTGTWGPQGGAPQPANASWLQIDGRVHAFAVHSNGTGVYCYEPVPPDDLEPDAGACAAATGTNGTIELQRIVGGTVFVGTFHATTHEILLAPPEDPSPVPGFVIAFFAALFLTTSVILAVLYLQERRVAHYLVRRLYEETKGRMPADWPENMRQQWIARIFVRGKN